MPKMPSLQPVNLGRHWRDDVGRLAAITDHQSPLAALWKMDSVFAAEAVVVSLKDDTAVDHDQYGAATIPSQVVPGQVAVHLD